MGNKSINKIWGVLVILFGSFFGTTAYIIHRNKCQESCNMEVKQTGKKMYVCSMHPQVVKSEPGDCPICGMMLIEKIAQPTSQKQKIYVCSMHPQVLLTQPGDCPICGMSLVEKADQAETHLSRELDKIIRPVNASVMAAVQTVNPVRSELPLTITASGIINFDARKIRTVSAKFGGLIEKSFVKFNYQPIHKGQKLYEIYCPDIYSDHWNYITVIKQFPDKPEINYEARKWFELLGLTNQQVEQIITQNSPNYHLPVCSEVEGFAVSNNFNSELNFSDKNEEGTLLGSASSSVGLNEGQLIERGTPLFKVLNTETVRADLKVRTEDTGLLQVGQKVFLRDAISPNQAFNATVSQIEPLNSGIFQLVKVYISNHEKLLLPGRKILANIELGNRKALWVPKSAIMNLGQQQMVFVLSDSTFIATTIKTGLRSDDQIEIVKGIDKDSKIALNASLLTDSDGFIKSNSR